MKFYLLYPLKGSWIQKLVVSNCPRILKFSAFSDIIRPIVCGVIRNSSAVFGTFSSFGWVSTYISNEGLYVFTVGKSLKKVQFWKSIYILCLKDQKKSVFFFKYGFEKSSNMSEKFLTFLLLLPIFPFSHSTQIGFYIFTRWRSPFGRLLLTQIVYGHTINVHRDLSSIEYGHTISVHRDLNSIEYGHNIDVHKIDDWYDNSQTGWWENRNY